jgi:ABC-type proline/glycine betaine transport system ATPase subunit
MLTMREVSAPLLRHQSRPTSSAAPRTLADRVVFMDGGRIVEAAAPAEFFGAPKTDRAKLFLSRSSGTKLAS